MPPTPCPARRRAHSARRPVASALLVAALLAACGAPPADAAFDAASDAASDAPSDAPSDAAPDATLRAATTASADTTGGWTPLFDGSTLAGWHLFKRPGVTDGWAVEDGAIVRVGPGGDLVSERAFGDFELAFEWRVDPGGNSGVFYRLAPDAPRTFESAPEYQILDDARHADGASRLTSAGAAYGLYPSPDGLLRPVGEWNSGRIIVVGDSVEHWLNGTRAAAYTLRSPEWSAKVAASKFAQWPIYGQAPRGLIGLQDHGDRVAFRALRIRERP